MGGKKGDQEGVTTVGGEMGARRRKEKFGRGIDEGRQGSVYGVRAGGLLSTSWRLEAGEKQGEFRESTTSAWQRGNQLVLSAATGTPVASAIPKPASLPPVHRPLRQPPYTIPALRLPIHSGVAIPVSTHTHTPASCATRSASSAGRHAAVRRPTKFSSPITGTHCTSI